MKKEIKRWIILLILIGLPLVSFAKYCPTCLQTFQSHTIRGETQTLYQWLVSALNPKNKIEYKNLKILFDKKVKFTVNGHQVAYGIPGVYRYLIRMRQKNPLLESQLKTLLADGKRAAVEYQTVTQRRGNKYRSLNIAILFFKAHKLVSWSAVSHITKVIN